MKKQSIKYLIGFVEDVRRFSFDYEDNYATVEHLIDCFRSYLEEETNNKQREELNYLMADATFRLNSCPIRH